jgi:hypothetical protein
MVKATTGYWDLDRCAWVVLDPAAATLPSDVRAAPGADAVLPEQREETTSPLGTTPPPTTAPQHRPA